MTATYDRNHLMVTIMFGSSQEKPTSPATVEVLDSYGRVTYRGKVEFVQTRTGGCEGKFQVKLDPARYNVNVWIVATHSWNTVSLMTL